MSKCAIVGEKELLRLMLRYLGEGQELDSDETQILLFAFYLESKAAGGLAKRAEDSLNVRLNKEQVAVRIK